MLENLKRYPRAVRFRPKKVGRLPEALGEAGDVTGLLSPCILSGSSCAAGLKRSISAIIAVTCDPIRAARLREYVPGWANVFPDPEG